MDKKSSYFKKLRSAIKFIVIGLITASPAIIIAPSQAANKKSDTPWYEVEVIIFANKHKLDADTETWPDTVQTTGYDTVYDLALPGYASMHRQNIYANGAYVLLRKNFMELNGIARRLKSSRDYDVVLHIAWRQPTYDENKAKPVFVFNGMLNKDPAPKPFTNPNFDPQHYDIYVDGMDVGPQYYWLSGTLKLSVSRYLHFETDLHMKNRTTHQEVIEQSPAEDSGGFGSFFGMSQKSTPITIERPVLQDYRLFESRRMRSKEIHYFDHPLMGLIVRVTPYEPEIPEPAKPAPQPIKQSKAAR